MGWFKSLGIALASSCAVYAVTVNNPIMYVDSPDPSIVRIQEEIQDMICSKYKE